MKRGLKTCSKLGGSEALSNKVRMNTQKCVLGGRKGFVKVLWIVLFLVIIQTVSAIEPKVAFHFSNTTWEYEKDISWNSEVSYMSTIYPFQRQLEEEKIPYDYITDQNITNGDLLDNGEIKYPILVSIGTTNLTNNVATNIVNYVNKGGILFTSGLFGSDTDLINNSLLGVNFTRQDLFFTEHSVNDLNITKIENHSVVAFFPEFTLVDYKRESDIVNATLDIGTQLMTWVNNATSGTFPYIVNNTYGNGTVIWWAEHRGYMNSKGSISATITPTAVMFYNIIKWAFEKQGMPFIQIWRWKQTYQSATGGLRMDVDSVYHEVYGAGRNSDVEQIANAGLRNNIPVYFFYGTELGYVEEGHDPYTYDLNGSIGQLCNHTGARIGMHFSDIGHLSINNDRHQKLDFERLGNIINTTASQLSITSNSAYVHEDSYSLNWTFTPKDNDGINLYSIESTMDSFAWSYADLMYFWVYPTKVQNGSRNTTPDYSSDLSIMAAYEFDSDSFLEDKGPYGNNISLINVSLGDYSNVSGWYGDNAINFNNVSYAKIPDDDSLSPTTEFSVAFMLKGEIRENCYVISKAGYNEVDDYAILTTNGDPDKIIIQLGDGIDADQESLYGGTYGSGWHYLNFLHNPSRNYSDSWHQFGFSYSAIGNGTQNNTYCWWLDGIKMRCGFFDELAENGVSGISNGANDLYLSAEANDPSDSGNYCNISLDHIVLSNRTWNTTDFQKHYSEAMDLLIKINGTDEGAGLKPPTIVFEDLVEGQWNEITFNLSQYIISAFSTVGATLVMFDVPSGVYEDDLNNTPVTFFLDDFGISNTWSAYQRNWTYLFDRFWDYLNSTCPNQWGYYNNNSYTTKSYVAAGFGTTELRGINSLLDYGFEYNAGDFVLGGIPSFVTLPIDKLRNDETNITYDIVTFPISHYWTDDGTNFDSFDSHNNATIIGGVDALYNAGILINFYTHGQAAQMDVLLDRIGNKSNIWKTDFDTLNTWWRERNNVSISYVNYSNSLTTLNITNSHLNSVLGISIKLGKNISQAIYNNSYLIFVKDDIVVLPQLSSGQTITVNVHNGTYNSSLARLTYIDADIDVFKAEYNQTSKEVNITINGTGTNKNISIIYNTTQNFYAYDNNQKFATITGGVVSSSTSTYLLSYNYSTGVFNFTIPSMSQHEIILQEYTPTVSETTPSPSGGGYPTFKPTQEQLQEGYEKSLRKNWEIQFEFNNETHTIKLDDIVNKTAIITVSNEPITFNLTINETKKLNLDDNNYYDLQIFLKDISDYEAALVVKLIHEEISKCEPDWRCSEWGECINYTQTRICTDLNDCNTTEGKPDEIRECCEPDWECSEWSECIEGKQTRICTDLNGCNVTEGRPDEVRECESKTDYLNIVIVSVLLVAIVVAGFLVRKRICLKAKVK